MSKLIIGASISNKRDASSEVTHLFNKEDFPKEIEIQNNSPADLYLPSLQMKMVKAYGKRTFTMTFATLMTTVVDLAQIARLRDMLNFAVISDEFGQVSPKPIAENPEPEPVAQNPEPVVTGETTETAVYAELVQELENGDLLVAVGDVQFEIKKIQLRADNTLTAGGLKAYQQAKGE